VVTIDFRRVGLVEQRHDYAVRQPLESLVTKLGKRAEYLGVIAVLKQNRHPSFERRRKRVECRKVAMVRMLVREPEVVDLVEHRRVELRFRQQAPRVVENLSGQPRVHEDRSVRAFRYDAGMSDEMYFHWNSLRDRGRWSNSIYVRSYNIMHYRELKAFSFIYLNFYCLS